MVGFSGKIGFGGLPWGRDYCLVGGLEIMGFWIYSFAWHRRLGLLRVGFSGQGMLQIGALPGTFAEHSYMLEHWPLVSSDYEYLF